MVIICKEVRFVQSVNYLKKILNNRSWLQKVMR
jgi:hypothetical protein